MLVALASLETTVLLTTGPGDAPLWFEPLGAGNLLAGLVAGGVLGRVIQARRLPAAA